MTKARDLGDFISDGTIAETVTADGLNLGDNEKIQLGASQDLQIYHSGTSSVIHDNGVGNLVLRADGLYINNAAGTENMVHAAQNGAVTLYYDNAAKLATSATGATVTGTIAVSDSFNATSGTFTVQSNGTDILNLTSTLMSPQTDGAISLGSSSNGFNELYLDGNANIGGNVIINSTANTPLLRFDESGAAKFFIGESSVVGGGAGYDLYAGTGDGISLFTNATEAMRIDTNGNVGIGTTSPSFANGGGLEINYSAGNGAHLKLTDAASGSGGVNGLDLYAFNTSGYIENYELGALVFRNAGAERFRIAGNGQWGLNGTNYGTAGQVLTSSGSGTAPTWADAAGGGTAEFTTSANTTAGDLVVLNTNGTVSPVSVTASFGTVSEYQLQGTAVYRTFDIYYDRTNGKAVVAYNRNGSGGDYRGKVIPDTFGSGNEFTINSGNLDNCHMAYDPDENTFVFIFSESGTGYYRTGQVVGGGMSVSSNTAFSGALSTIQSAEMASVYDPDAQKILVVWKKTQVTGNTQFVVGTVSGSSITWGSEEFLSSQTIGGGSFGEPSVLAYDEGQNRVIWAFRDSDNSNYLSARVGSWTGSNYSWSSSTVIDSNANYGLALTYDPVSGKTLITYDRDANNYGYYRVLTLSGSTLSVGSEGTYGTKQAKYSTSYYNEASQALNVATSDDSSGMRLYSGTISGTTFTTSASADIDPSNGRCQNLMSTYNVNTTDAMVPFTDASSSDVAKYVHLTTTSNDGANFIGVAAETITSGSSGKITVLGGVNENQTGLTVNSRYYVSSAGTLTTTNTGTSVGRAVATTKILVTGGQ